MDQPEPDLSAIDCIQSLCGCVCGHPYRELIMRNAITYMSSTFLIVFAISLFVKGFMAKALMPAAFADSSFTA